MNPYRQLSLDELCDRLAEKKNTLIVFHARPDADAVGSAFALREILCAMGIPAMCACASGLCDSMYSSTVSGALPQ